VRVMTIKGDREPGHLPNEEFLAQMGRYNQELSKAGVLLGLAALHWSAEGVRIKFSGGKRTVIDGPLRRGQGDRRWLLDPPGEVDGGQHAVDGSRLSCKQQVGVRAPARRPNQITA
jgi:hypothetical protein